MNWPRVTTTLHFRVPALFLVLLIAVGSFYYMWMERTVFAPPAQDAVEANWYAYLADAEVDSLALLAEAEGEDDYQHLAVDYGAGIIGFDAEVIFFDAEDGHTLATSQPDSLTAAVGSVDPSLLVDMSSPDWAFDEIYPDPTNIDAYVNRIFYVAEVHGTDGQTEAYLAASFKPMIFSEEDVALDPRQLWLQAMLVGLVASFMVGWFVMAWLTRRINILSSAVSDFARGDLTRRVNATSSDDLGRLGRDFNAMAENLETIFEELQNKEQFQRQLIANISHDLRTPMSSLRGYIETLHMHGHDLETTEYERYLGIITSNLAHLDRLVDHLLQLSRLDAGQARFNLEEFPLPELIEGVLGRSEMKAVEKSIALSCDCPDDLPLIQADPVQIVQVLQNLVENAVKFTQEGGEVVVIVRSKVDKTVEVVVRDDGPGIALEDQPFIFERFFTVDRSRTQKGQSSGLGLAISAKIVEGHGSQLTVESQPGHGACFRFHLKAVSEDLLEGEAEG